MGFRSVDSHPQESGHLLLHEYVGVGAALYHCVAEQTLGAGRVGPVAVLAARHLGHLRVLQVLEGVQVLGVLAVPGEAAPSPQLF